METKKNSIESIPKFEKSFLLPRYRGAWLGVFVFAGIALMPPPSRDPILGRLDRFVGRSAKSSRHQTQINLLYRFSEESEHEREAIIDAMHTSAPQAMATMVEPSLRNLQKILARVDWQGKETIGEMQRNNGRVIFLALHAQGVDILAVLMAFGGQKMVAVFHNQSNPVFDYVWNAVYRRFGRRIHACNSEVKPFIQSVRQGYQGYYLPDQDRDAEHSEFVDFFATHRATLPAIDHLMEVCCAHVVPLFPVYDGQTHHLTVLVCPPTDDLLDAGDTTIVRRIDEEVGVLVKPHTEQYTWVLKLLKTRRPGEIRLCKRKELSPKKQSKKEPVGIPDSLAILCQ